MNMFKPNTTSSPEEYIAKLEEPRKSEIQKLHDLIRETVPNLKPFMISGLIGYGQYHYKSKSGREGEWYIIGLASQKNYISLYCCAVDGKEYLAEKYKNELPKASIGKSCIRFKKVEDLDVAILKKLFKESEKSPLMGT
jgi:hypothetical protein